MYYRIISNPEGFKLHRSSVPEDGERVRGKYVSDREIDSGALNPANEDLRRFFLAIQVLLAGEKQQRVTIERITTTGAHDVKTGVKFAADYLEIYLYPDIVRKRKYGAKRKKQDMEKYDELIALLGTALAPIKEALRLPAINPAEYCYTVPATILVSNIPLGCKNYLKSLVTYGVLTDYKAVKVFSRLERDFPEQAANIIAAMKETASRDHLSAVSFNDASGQLLVSVVNVSGDLLQLEGYKFLRLIEEHGNDQGGWLSLGNLERKGDWLPDPCLKFNKETSGEIVARYYAPETCLEVKLRTTEGKTGKTGISGQALFILDQEYLLCLYIAIMRLKNDKRRFEELREVAETKKISNIADLEDDLFE